jgi:hypothetical protein
MLRGYTELWLAVFVCVLITGGYGAMVVLNQGVPAASELFGHTIGIIGFILMLMTETFYSLRKRVRFAAWGKLSSWLKFHIFMGLVGPYMVLLHTSWKFNGLAGATTLLTIIIVVSGFIGRYIFTRIPRTLDGLEIEGTLSQEALKARASTHGIVAHRSHSYWHCAVHFCVRSYWRGVVLRHIFQVGGGDEQQSSWVSYGYGGYRSVNYSLCLGRRCICQRRRNVQFGRSQ